MSVNDTILKFRKYERVGLLSSKEMPQIIRTTRFCGVMDESSQVRGPNDTTIGKSAESSAHTRATYVLLRSKGCKAEIEV